LALAFAWGWQLLLCLIGHKINIFSAYRRQVSLILQLSFSLTSHWLNRNRFYFPHLPPSPPDAMGQLLEMCEPCLNKPIRYDTAFLHYIPWFRFSAQILHRYACLWKVCKCSIIPYTVEYCRFLDVYCNCPLCV
jgi:hypothetical protein